MKDLITVKNYALDQLREYLIINDVEISNKEELIVLFSKMYKEGYFYKAEINEVLDVVKETFEEFGKAFEKDKDILEKDLIFLGHKKVLDKLNSNKVKR